MPVATVFELAAAVLLIVGAIVLYRHSARIDPQHGSQGAVLLLVVGVILLIHGTGQLEYHPSAAELEAAQ
ncbi:MAG: hypothetical protein ABI626_02275 [Sphingomicrobium sp.]